MVSPVSTSSSLPSEVESVPAKTEGTMPALVKKLIIRTTEGNDPRLLLFIPNVERHVSFDIGSDSELDSPSPIQNVESKVSDTKTATVVLEHLGSSTAKEPLAAEQKSVPLESKNNKEKKE